jgi:5'-nucleotidase
MKCLARPFLAALLFLLALAPALAAETAQITLLHTSDLHGYLLPFDYTGEKSFLNGFHPDMGGLARRATLIKKLRAEIKSPLLVVDSGDLFWGGPWDKRTRGVPEVEAYNLMGYDLYCVGNHDLEPIFGEESFPNVLQLIARSKFPWLSANLTKPDGSRFDQIPPYVIRQCGPLRVGFLGLTDITNAPRYGQQYFKDIKAGDPIAAARHWVPIARKQCDVLIGLTHLGDMEDPKYDNDLKVIAAVPGLDAVVGGHGHDYTETPVWRKNPQGEPVPVFYPGEYGVALNRIDLTFERKKTWRLTQAKQTLIPITSALTEDPAVAELIGKHLGSSLRPGPQWPIPRLAAAPTIDGDLGEWRAFPPQRVGLNQSQVHFLTGDWTGAEDCSASAWVGWNETGLYFAADITDDKFSQDRWPETLYENDSVQIAFDPNLDRNTGRYLPDDREYWFASLNGKTVTYCSQGPKWGKRSDLNAKAVVKSDGKGWTLEAMIPWSELEITAPHPGLRLGFTWVVNDSDTGDYDDWLEWTPGLAGKTDPFSFGTLELGK